MTNEDLFNLNKLAEGLGGKALLYPGTYEEFHWSKTHAGETPVLVDSTAGIALIGSQPIVEYFEETVDKMPMIHGNATARAEIRRLGMAFNEMVAKGELKGMIVAAISIVLPGLAMA